MDTSPAWSSGASLSPALSQCLPIAPILHRAGSSLQRMLSAGCRGLAVPRGVSAGGQSGLPAPPRAGLGSALQLSMSSLFFPPAVGQVFN